VTTRETEYDDWGPAENLGDVINSKKVQKSPWLSADGLELYYAQGIERQEDIIVSTRNSPSEPWGAPENLGTMINSSATDSGPSLTADGLELYFDSSRSGRQELYMSTRATVSDPWGQAINLSSTVNSTYGDDLWGDGGPSISPDGLTLLFNSARPPGDTYEQNIWMTRRSTRESEWEPPMLLALPGYSAHGDFTPSIGNSMLYFGSSRSGPINWDLWQVPILPIVDFTGDYKIDIQDLLILIEHWGQNEPAFDMGPTPFGDGIIDAADLEVLMRHWDQELDDPYFIAQWKLDETEGMFAADGIGDNNGIVFGNPTWKPDDGQANGALEFDGIDDMIIVKPVLNPEDSPFSVFAWIKGGAPGQAVVSQQNGVNWLQVDTDGTLMTELSKSGGRITGVPLYSETVITDGNWHRVGLVWDGSDRILYVDDVEVASGALGGLTGSDGGLYIGTGNSSEAGTFWSGMIDDVRIYDRAVAP
jgi:hypothetical protein